MDRLRQRINAWDEEMLDEATDRVVLMREALEAHMAYFEWKCTAPAAEVVAQVPERWNAVVLLTERALERGPQERWRIGA